MKKLGFGLMRLPVIDGDYTNVDIEKSKQLIDRFMDAGFSYFDTAYIYHGGMSEKVFGQLVASRYPRESFTITSKMPVFRMKSAEEYPQIFDEQLKRCCVDYFDFYFLHSLGKSVYEKIQRDHGFEFIAKKKAEGKIRHIGFSFHDDSEMLERILNDHPEVELVQLQINYIDWENESIQSRKCYEVCRRHGVKIAIMEPLKGGALVNIPSEAQAVLKKANPALSIASWGIRYAASLEDVIIVLSGMSEDIQVEDNISYMNNFSPLSECEKAALSKAVEIIEKTVAIPCTACRYCTEGCPKNIAIPEYFALYNNQEKFGLLPGLMTTFVNTTKAHGKPSECIGCGECESHCPQHINIREWLASAASKFEK